jgi:hypothetical protein
MPGCGGVGFLVLVMAGAFGELEMTTIPRLATGFRRLKAQKVRTLAPSHDRPPGELGHWEGWIGIPGDAIEHAHASCRGAAEDAIHAAMARAEQKYKGQQQWERWTFRAELIRVPPVALTVYFEWRDGGLVQIPKPGEVRQAVRSRRR